MKEHTSLHYEKLFLLAAAVGMAACVFLAFWFTVPFTSEASDTSISTVPLMQSARVDLNTAGPDALATLPGVGEKRARDIIAYRLQRGAFQRVEDVVDVPGITPELVASWKELAYVS